LLGAYADPVATEENGANAYLGEAVGKDKSARPGTLLEGRYASGTASDQFAQVK
jgi:hypothetical protein